MTSTHFPRRIPLTVTVVAVLVTCALSGAGSSADRPETSPAASSTVTARVPSRVTPSAPTATEARLPDLAMLPLEAFHVAYEGNRKVLRFSADMENLGRGPLDVTGVRSNTRTPYLTVTQNISLGARKWRRVSTRAVMRYSALDGHNHFHLLNFERYRLREVGSTTWRVDHKEGFCMRDNGNLGGRTAFHYEDDCGSDAPRSLRVGQGLSQGWVDVYDWYLEGQFVQLAGLHLPGYVCVSATVDPLNQLTEKTRSNNTTSSLVYVTQSRATVLRQPC